MLSCASQLVRVSVCSRSAWLAANTWETAPPVSLATRSMSVRPSASQPPAMKRARPFRVKSWSGAAGAAGVDVAGRAGRGLHPAAVLVETFHFAGHGFSLVWRSLRYSDLKTD